MLQPGPHSYNRVFLITLQLLGGGSCFWTKVMIVSGARGDSMDRALIHRPEGSQLEEPVIHELIPIVTGVYLASY